MTQDNSNDSQTEDYVRFSNSPWWNENDKQRVGEPNKRGDPAVHGPVDDIWSDLLLELTLTTAYANITANTPVVDVVSIFSFLAFFALVWWIWASQVIYNVRFRTKDVVHRIFAGLQFFIFGVMATFTSDFNVFSGLLQDSSDKLTGPVNFNISHPDLNNVFLTSLKRDKLPSLNARGISMAMACSRMLLFIQYGIVLYHFYSWNHKTLSRKEYKSSIMIHMGTLLFSSVAYLIAFGVGGYHPTSGGNIAKIFLWFAPVIIEIGSYFYINKFHKLVGIQSESLHERSTILFIVVLSEGLNQITGSFKYIVGAVGFTAKGGTIMLSAGIIVMAELFLYSKNNRKEWDGSNRILLWFFSHYVLMGTLILALQCVRTLLSFANLQTSINALLDMVVDGYVWMISHGHGTVKAEMFPEAAAAFADLGINFSDFVAEVNNWGRNASTLDLAKTLFFVACVTFNEFDAFPPQGSALYDEVKAFFEDTTFDTHRTYKVLGDLLASRLRSALWFWGTAGGTLVVLAILSLLKQPPREIKKYERLSIASRFVAGSIFMILSALTAGRNQPYFANWEEDTTDPHISRPWKAMGDSGLIPSFAIVLLFVAFVDIVLVYAKKKKIPQSWSDEGKPPISNPDGASGAENRPLMGQQPK